PRQAAVSFGTSTQLLDLETGKNLGQRMWQPGGINHMAWHPQGDLLVVSANDRKIYIWNPETGRQTVVLEGLKNAGLWTTFNRTGDVLVSSGWEWTLRFWHPRTGKQLFSTSGSMTAPCFAPGDRQIAAGVAKPDGEGLDGLWDVAGPREYRTLVNDLSSGRPPEQPVSNEQ